MRFDRCDVVHKVSRPNNAPSVASPLFVEDRPHGLCVATYIRTKSSRSPVFYACQLLHRTIMKNRASLCESLQVLLSIDEIPPLGTTKNLDNVASASSPAQFADSHRGLVAGHNKPHCGSSRRRSCRSTDVLTYRPQVAFFEPEVPRPPSAHLCLGYTW